MIAVQRNLFFFLSGGIFALAVAMGIGRFAYTPLLPHMQNDLSFTNAAAGYLATSNYAGYFAGALFLSFFSPRNHRTILLRSSLIVSILTTLWMGLTHSLVLMMAVRFFSGVSSAFIFILASSIVLDKLAFLKKTSFSGLFYSGVGFGIFLTGCIIPGLIEAFHWEGAWIGLALASGVFTVFIWIFLIDTPHTATKTEQKKKEANILPPKWLPWLIAAYGLEGFGYIITGTFIVAMAAQDLNAINEPTTVWSIVGLAAIPSCLFWSLIAKKIGYVRSLMCTMICQAAGIILPAIWTTYAGLMISAILFGATFMGISTLSTTLAKLIQPQNSSQIIGVLTAIYATGQMIGPIIAGILATITNRFHGSLIVAASAVMLGGLLLISGLHLERPASTIQKSEGDKCHT